jgi:hypothetical protein
MLNLPATFRLDAQRIGSAYELPVLVDIQWLGQTMTSDNAGIIPSRASQVRPPFSTLSDDSAICI